MLPAPPAKQGEERLGGSEASRVRWTLLSLDLLLGVPQLEKGRSEISSGKLPLEEQEEQGRRGKTERRLPVVSEQQRSYLFGFLRHMMLESKPGHMAVEAPLRFLHASLKSFLTEVALFSSCPFTPNKPPSPPLPHTLLVLLRFAF